MPTSTNAAPHIRDFAPDGPARRLEKRRGKKAGKKRSGKILLGLSVTSLALLRVSVGSLLWGLDED